MTKYVQEKGWICMSVPQGSWCFIAPANWLQWKHHQASRVLLSWVGPQLPGTRGPYESLCIYHQHHFCKRMLLSLLTERSTNLWKYSIPNYNQDQEELPIYLSGDLNLQVCSKSSNVSFSGKKRELKPPPCSISSFPKDPRSHKQEAKGDLQSAVPRCWALLTSRQSTPISPLMLSTLPMNCEKNRGIKESCHRHIITRGRDVLGSPTTWAVNCLIYLGNTWLSSFPMCRLEDFRLEQFQLRSAGVQSQMWAVFLVTSSSVLTSLARAALTLKSRKGI